MDEYFVTSEHNNKAIRKLYEFVENISIRYVYRVISEYGIEDKEVKHDLLRLFSHLYLNGFTINLKEYLYSNDFIKKFVNEVDKIILDRCNKEKKEIYPIHLISICIDEEWFDNSADYISIRTLFSSPFKKERGLFSIGVHNGK